jgi:hypothetical protein
MEDNTETNTFEYLDGDSIDEELLCSICAKPLHLPVCDPQCGHTFCQECIEKWLENSSHCPTCRQRVNIKNYTPVTTRTVLNQLSRLRIKCNLCQEMNIENRGKHIEICPKQIIQCISADIKCQWSGKREEFDLHLVTCPFQQIRPIIDLLMNEINTIRETQCKQQRFIEAIINDGYILSHICTASPCLLNRPYIPGKSNTMSCFLCNKQTLPETIAVHSCITITCICKCCFTKHTQQLPPLAIKRKASSSEEDDGNDRVLHSMRGGGRGRGRGYPPM